jgi:hypothetical protein
MSLALHIKINYNTIHPYTALQQLTASENEPERQCVVHQEVQEMATELYLIAATIIRMQ